MERLLHPSLWTGIKTDNKIENEQIGSLNSLLSLWNVWNLNECDEKETNKKDKKSCYFFDVYFCYIKKWK